jgi:hypothetical protein
MVEGRRIQAGVPLDAEIAQRERWRGGCYDARS